MSFHQRRVGLLFVMSLLAGAVDLSAEPLRSALIVGNAAYDGEAALKNPVNDASDVAEALKAQGWKVTLVRDADRRTFSRALLSWSDDLATQTDSQALFYYAGHGMQVEGENFLLPVKTAFETVLDVKSDAVNVNDVTAALERAKVSVSLIVLDACRDNPFAKSATRSATSTRGLVAVRAPATAQGAAVIFSTGPGDVAQDGTGRNGVFTMAFLKQISTGLPVDEAFKAIGTEVRTATGGQQKPWINASLTSDVYLTSPELRAKMKQPALEVVDITRGRVTVVLDPAQAGSLDLTARPLTATSSKSAAGVLKFLTVSQANRALEDKTNFSGEGRALKNGSTTLTPGAWLLSARLPEDPEQSWYQVVQFAAGEDVRVLLPLISDSTTVQLAKAKEARATLLPQLNGAKFARGAWNTTGWLLTVPASLGALYIYAWYNISRPILISNGSTDSQLASSDQTTNVLFGSAIGVFSLLSLGAFSVPTPDKTLQAQMDVLDDQIANLIPLVTTTDSFQ